MRLALIDIDNTLLDFDEYVRQTMQSGFAHFPLQSAPAGAFRGQNILHSFKYFAKHCVHLILCSVEKATDIEIIYGLCRVCQEISMVSCEIAGQDNRRLKSGK